MFSTCPSVRPSVRLSVRSSFVLVRSFVHLLPNLQTQRSENE